VHTSSTMGNMVALFEIVCSFSSIPKLNLMLVD
jgi:hypothetical protein